VCLLHPGPSWHGPYYAFTTKRPPHAPRNRGLFVGSGVVEAACKTIIGHRLKQSDMRWTVRGANAIIALQCCELGGRWETLWEARSANPYIRVARPDLFVR
jgi:hypothetical protein